MRTLPLLFIAFAGCGGDARIEFVTSTLDFGKTDCGATAAPRAVLITNPTDTAFNFTIALDAKSHYTAVPASGTLLPRSQTEVAVYSAAIPSDSATTDNLYGETMTVTTDLPGDSPHPVAISQTAHGAILQLSADTVDFPDPQPLGGTPATMPFSVKNVGNADVSVTVTSTYVTFDFAPAGAQALAAGGTLSGNLEYLGGATASEHSGISATVDGPVCAAMPKAVASGAGVAKALAVRVVPTPDRGRGRRNGGASTVCVLTTNHTVACAGLNTFGMRGATDDYLNNLGTTFGKGPPPPSGGDLGVFNSVQTETGLLRDVVELAGGRGFFCARRQQKDVWCWGAYPGSGRPNNISLTPVMNPHATKVIDNGVIALAAGYSNICTIREPFNNLICKSHDSGAGGTFPRDNWQLSGAAALSVAGGVGYGVLTDGSVMSFGRNSQGERGNNDIDDAPASAVTGLTNVSKVAAGGSTSPNRGSRFGCALDTANHVWCWGRNQHGQLGQGNTSGNSNVAQQVLIGAATTLDNATDIAAGQQHSCALVDGGVWCWGRGREGQTGRGNTGDFPFAAQTNPALTNAVSLGIGSRGSCAVLATGGIRCWGQFQGSTATSPFVVEAFEP